MSHSPRMSSNVARSWSFKWKVEAELVFILSDTLQINQIKLNDTTLDHLQPEVRLDLHIQIFTHSQLQYVIFLNKLINKVCKSKPTIIVPSIVPDSADLDIV